MISHIVHLVIQTVWNKNNHHNRESKYNIQDCIFEHNIASITTKSDIVNQPGSNGNSNGNGGGIHISFRGESLQNCISIVNSTFYNNSAQYGGGLNAFFQDNTNGSNITVTGCHFSSNSARDRGGGAIILGFIHFNKNSVVHNTIKIQKTVFIYNYGGQGGAVLFFSSRTKTKNTNKMEFINCTWIENLAKLGAAMALRPTVESSLFDGTAPTPILHNCSFINNEVIKSATFIYSVKDNTTKHVLESGALHIESIEIELWVMLSLKGVSEVVP